MKAYIVKYVLTKGIYEVDGEIEDDVLRVRNKCESLLYFKNEWVKTKEEALKFAEDKRVKRIKSLKKQIEKLENIKFI